MSPPRPKVSVCVITYNQERYIRECLQSLRRFDFAKRLRRGHLHILILVAS